MSDRVFDVEPDLHAAVSEVRRLEHELAEAREWRNEAIGNCLDAGWTSGDVARAVGINPGTVEGLASAHRRPRERTPTTTGGTTT